MTRAAAIEGYKEYVDLHISNVKRAFKEFGEELCKRLSIDARKLEWQIEDHDRSKYTEEEFNGYRLNFYKSDEDEESEEEVAGLFDKAWLHHCQVNSHHPEFWLYEDEKGDIQAYPMPRYAIAEMLLDWQAMGYTHNDNAYLYWNSDKCVKPLNPATTEIVNSVIDIFK